jgi:transcriptional regulator with XRE-family HTH domain
MLGQIERMESSPTIATLWKIATGLECSFSSFLSSLQQVKDVPEESFEHDPNMLVRTLFPFSPESHIEMFEITLRNHHEQISQAHQIGVREHIYVVSGGLSVLVNGQWEPLLQGDKLLLHADTEHGYRDEAGATVFTTTIHYPRP